MLAVYYGQICEFLESAGPNVDSKLITEKFPPKNAISKFSQKSSHEQKISHFDLFLAMELCAGIIDKDLPPIEIAREELIEECGYDIKSDRLEEVIRFRSGVGTTGSLQIMYYCEVTDDDKVKGGGGGVDDEIIDVGELTIDEVKDLVKQGTTHTSPPAFLFGILWFLNNKAPK